MLATVKGWSDDAHVLSFTEDEWDVVNANQVRCDYSVQGVNQLVRFNNANNTVRTADESKPTDSKQASSEQQSNDGQHHNSNLATDKANNLVTNMSDNGTDENDNDMDNKNLAYEHSYNAGFDVGTVYTAGYTNGHANRQDAMVVSDNDNDNNCNSDNKHYGDY